MSGPEDTVKINYCDKVRSCLASYRCNSIPLASDSRLMKTEKHEVLEREEQRKTKWLWSRSILPLSCSTAADVGAPVAPLPRDPSQFSGVPRTRWRIGDNSQRRTDNSRACAGGFRGQLSSQKRDIFRWSKRSPWSDVRVTHGSARSDLI